MMAAINLLFRRHFPLGTPAVAKVVASANYTNAVNKLSADISKGKQKLMEGSNANPPLDGCKTSSCNEQLYAKQEDEIKHLRSEVTELKTELYRLREDIKVLEATQNKPEESVVVEGRDAKVPENSTWKRIDEMEKKKKLSTHSQGFNVGMLCGSQMKSVKYLAEQYQRMSEPEKYRNM